MSKGIKNFGSLIQKLGEILGVKKNFPTHSPKIVMFNFPKFLHMGLKLKWLKTLKVARKSVRCVSRYFAFSMLGECLVCS